MTDYESEQTMELEALEAILMDDLQVYSGMLPDTWAAVGQTYKVVIDPREEGEEAAAHDEEKLMELLFAHTAKYPEEPPCLRLRAVRGLSDADIAAGTAHLEQQVQENLGMAMIFTLVTAAREWLRNIAGSGAGAVDPELERRRQADEEEAKRAAARAHGTPVTIDSFNAWKAKYDAERAAARALLEAAKEKEGAARLSGKAWFLKEAPSGDHEAEAGALSEDDEEYEDAPLEEEDEDELEEDELDYEDDDDEGMLDEL
mmetsp:Transcript_13868/g.29929  ORF Transcript_13868/g.29929 Transcript_13868/m.29929 type:complete len:259 (+) Transcript_13868:285-1061(+)